MFNFSPGVKLPFPERMREEYQVFDNRILLNLSFEKIGPLLHDFTAMLDEPLFLVFTEPLTQGEEKDFRKNDTDFFHRGIYYLDGLSKEQVFELLQKYEEVLLNDGLSEFGVASHTSGEELFIQKYKTISIYTKDFEKYKALLRRYDIPETSNILTPRATFSAETPGEAFRLTTDGIDVYDVQEELTKLGMYRAKVIIG